MVYTILSTILEWAVTWLDFLRAPEGFYEALESIYLASALIVPKIVPDPLLHDTQIICASRKKDFFVL